MKDISSQCSKCKSSSGFHLSSLVTLTRKVEIRNTKQKVSYKDEKIYVRIPLCIRCYISGAKNGLAIILGIALYIVLLISIFLSFYQKGSLDNIIPLVIFIALSTIIYWGCILLAHLFIPAPSPVYIPEQLESFAYSHGFIISGRGETPRIVVIPEEGFMERRDAIKYIKNELHFDAH